MAIADATMPFIPPWGFDCKIRLLQEITTCRCSKNNQKDWPKKDNLLMNSFFPNRSGTKC